MPNNYVFFTLFTIACVTIGLRLFPFVLGRSLFKNPAVTYVAKRMPVGVMCLLVIYTIKNQNYHEAPYGAPVFLASGIALFMYWYTNNALISIFCALFVYLGFVNYNLFPLFGA